MHIRESGTIPSTSMPCVSLCCRHLVKQFPAPQLNSIKLFFCNFHLWLQLGTIYFCFLNIFHPCSANRYHIIVLIEAFFLACNKIGEKHWTKVIKKPHSLWTFLSFFFLPSLFLRFCFLLSCLSLWHLKLLLLCALAIMKHEFFSRFIQRYSNVAYWC